MTQRDLGDLNTEVVSLLAENGYSPLARTQKIADVEVDMGGVWEGPSGSLDLSFVVDRPPTREDGLRLYWTVQRLARALDAAHSRRTLTVILVGETGGDRNPFGLLEIARVLVVDGTLPVERMLAPLRPIHLPPSATTEIDGLNEVLEELERAPQRRELVKLVRAAETGASSVQEQYLAWVEDSFVGPNKTSGE